MDARSKILSTIAQASREALSSASHAFPRITRKRAIELAGSALGQASKMPSATYGISALKCKTGAKLARVAGSICSTCYANPELSANYAYPSVVKSHARRLEALERDPWAWAHGMVELIRRDGRPYFRWHDSGDVQSLEHLRAIVAVCEATPQVKHWLPTKEYKITRAYLRVFGAFPWNLTVRLSAPMIGEGLPESLQAFGLTWSVAHYHGETVPDSAQICHAYVESVQGGACGDCRACWDSDEPVSYPVHVSGRKVERERLTPQMELAI